MRRRAAGWSLIEMLVAVSLMGLVTALAGRLLVHTMAVQGTLDRAQATSIQMDTVLRLLRNDVWNAAEISVEAEDWLVLELGDGTRVQWSAGASADTKSAHGATEQPWMTRAATGANGQRRVREIKVPAAVRFDLVSPGVIAVTVNDQRKVLGSELVRLRRAGWGQP